MSNTISEIKNILGRGSSIVIEAEEQIHKLEDIMVEINETEHNKQKKIIKSNVESFRDLR